MWGAKRLRIAYVSVSTPFSRASWSGIPWYSHREVLRRFPDTHVLETPITDALTTRLSLMERFGLSVRRRRMIAQHYRKLINGQLEKLKPDAVIAVAAAHKIAYIEPKWPLIYAADAMYATVVDYYGKYAALPSRTRLQGNMLQRALLERVDRALLCSQWAIDAARAAYGLPEEMLREVPMGANLDEDPGFQAPTISGPLTLLFVGYDWQRKGGPLLLQIAQELRRRTGDAELHVVGVSPREARGADGVYLHGRIDKSNRHEFGKLIELYRRSSFFTMPSREEAFGIVHCEAAAFGRPSVAAQTGGVAGIVRDGRSGLLLPLNASAADYADRILNVWQQPADYIAMCAEARRQYETRLNWTQWGDALANAVDEVVRHRGQ